MGVTDTVGHGVIGIHTQEDAEACLRANKPLEHLSERNDGRPIAKKDDDPGEGETIDGGSQEGEPKFLSPRCKKSET